ncbi:MAG: methionine aminotransferase [Bacteroidota bacterium]
MRSAVSTESKLPLTGVSIFAKMSALANEHGAINLAQGFPDFHCDPELIRLVNKAMSDGHNQYAPLAGVPALREIIAAKTEKLYGASYAPLTEITITSGATQAIFTAITALIRQDDEVIIFSPAYDCYEPAIDLAGGKTVHVTLKQPDFSIDWTEVRRLVNPKTRMIVLNTPHNPTGAVLNMEDMRELEKITEDSNIIVLSDEVYEHIVFDGQQHLSVSRFPKLAERSLVVSSFGKTFHNTGWKMGYIIAPQELMNEFRKVHQFNVFSANTPVQVALAEFLKDEERYLSLNNFYQDKRDFFASAVGASRLTFTPARGTYFQLLDYSALSDKTDVEYAEELTIKHKLAAIPISVFYPTDPGSRLLRFCFAKGEETLEKAAEILNKL